MSRASAEFGYYSVDNRNHGEVQVRGMAWSDLYFRMIALCINLTDSENRLLVKVWQNLKR